MEYLAQVRVHEDPKWYNNGIVFDSIIEAEKYAEDLFQRWTQCDDWRVLGSEDDSDSVKGNIQIARENANRKHFNKEIN
tara:strand:- start:532 stop:768 length:237 start_codon:yes stop_codon:yes gene_type:complete